jgi:hypothetical protein
LISASTAVAAALSKASEIQKPLGFLPSGLLLLILRQ